MGHFISRAFRRMTQCSQAKSAIQQQEHSKQEEDKNASQSRIPEVAVAEAIPVGQSIDSADYAQLEPEKREPDEEDKRSEDRVKEQLVSEPKEQAGIEEAAIKIQALVRGHLTRRALKDGHYHSLPQANSLGQSQFDEESLIQNPPSAVFQSPLNLAAAANSGPAESRLGSIAEIGRPERQTALAEQVGAPNKRPPVSLNLRSSSSPSQLGAPEEATRDSVSPAPSEANASIDLGACDTPASASIDIQDHNLRPTDRMASVLHHKTAIVEQLTDGDLLGSPDSNSQEAAAIRIQSAFRGYRTRKNSPYRSRSPKSSPNKRQNAERLHFGPAVDELELDEDEQQAQVSRVAQGDRRASRPRDRESSPQIAQQPREQLQSELTNLDQQKAECGHESLHNTISIDELSNAEDRTVREVLPSQQQRQGESESASVAPTETPDQDASRDNHVNLLEPDQSDELPQARLDALQDARASVGAKSELSELDTDSILGAALSLNEQVSLSSDPALPGNIEGQIDDEKSRAFSMTTEELESEVRRLVEDLDLSGSGNGNSNADDENTSVLEQAAGQLGAVLSDEPESVVAQQELDSDDIERRDPSGQASEQRARSPQIATSNQPLAPGGQVESVLADCADEPREQEHGLQVDCRQLHDDTNDSSQLLAPPQPDDDGASLEASSGRTSPALSNSAGSSSSSENDSDQEAAEKQQQQQQQQQQQHQQQQKQQQQQPGSRNKNRRNRNKRKGKK